MADVATEGFSLIKRSPGILLVTIGFMTIYFLVGLKGSEHEPNLLTYCGVGFGFLVTFAGMIMLFRELGDRSIVGPDVDMAITSSDIEQAVNQLGKNYDILRRQATQGFILAGTFMAMGILVILAGSLGEMFGFTKTASNLTTVAGVVVEAVSGLGLYLFKETFKRLNLTSDRLYDMWKILAAFKKAESLPDDKKSEVIVNLITKLVEIPSPTKSG
jgi:hypothetical protein